MDSNGILVIGMMTCFIGLLFTGYPIAFILGGVAMLFTLIGYCSDLWLGTITGLDYMTIGLVVNRLYKVMHNWILIALPMFIFMGLMLDRSGIAEKMMIAMQGLFGRVRGGACHQCHRYRYSPCCGNRYYWCICRAFRVIVPAGHAQTGVFKAACCGYGVCLRHFGYPYSSQYYAGNDG